MQSQTIPLLKDSTARSILESLCKEHDITIELIEELIEVQRNNLGRARQIGITSDFNSIINNYIEIEDD